MRNVDIYLLPGGQSDFVFDVTSPFKAFVGGMGSGKTYGAVASSLLLGSLNAPLPGVFVEPTFSIIKDAALPAFEDLLDENAIPYSWHASDHVLSVGRGRSAFQIFMRSGDRPHRLIGFNAAWGMIDEPGQQKSEIFKRVVQRCRSPEAKFPQIGLSGTPEGLNWFYRVCEAQPPTGMRLYRGRTADNPFLPPGYLENLFATLSNQEIAAYAEGRFVNLTSGSVYPSFDRHKHGRMCIGPLDGDILVGCDFNVAKMVWPIARRVGNELHVFDEVTGVNTNTYRQAEALENRLRDWFAKERREEFARGGFDMFKQTVKIYTDATGAARKTSASESDVAILQSRGFWVMPSESNPPIRDRVHTLERRFRERAPITGAPITYVDVERCRELTHALEGQAYGPDGLPEKKHGAEDLSGPNDALGYMVWGQFEWRASLPTGNRVAIQQYE